MLDAFSVVFNYEWSIWSANMLHPLQVQERMQKELDEHVGSERTVTISDRGQLPYLNSVINEGMRIRPVSPVLIPHTAMTNSR